jgi:hypothetical protein
MIEPDSLLTGLFAPHRINGKLRELSIDPDALLPAGWRPLLLSVSTTPDLSQLVHIRVPIGCCKESHRL